MIQLSQAACDPVKIHYIPEEVYPSGSRRLSISARWAGNTNIVPPHETDMEDPQDIGIELFSTDSLEGGLPDKEYKPKIPLWWWFQDKPDDFERRERMLETWEKYYGPNRCM